LIASFLNSDWPLTKQNTTHTKLVFFVTFSVFDKRIQAILPKHIKRRVNNHFVNIWWKESIIDIADICSILEYNSGIKVTATDVDLLGILADLNVQIIFIFTNRIDQDRKAFPLGDVGVHDCFWSV